MPGGGTFWWGEATDEPAREDARPTESRKTYHYPMPRCRSCAAVSAIFLDDGV